MKVGNTPTPMPLPSTAALALTTSTPYAPTFAGPKAPQREPLPALQRSTRYRIDWYANAACSDSPISQVRLVE